MSQRILIVGGVAAGASAATRARRMDPRAEIVVFEKGGYPSFANCGLPYYVGDIIRDRGALLLQTPERFKKRFDIDVHVRHEVLRIDRDGKRILVRDLDHSRERWERYDKLILATGANPIVPPFNGVGSENVFVLRSMEDTDAMRAFVDGNPTKRAVVVGAGFIGLEVAEALVHRGINVDVVELAPQVLPPLDADMARPVAAHLKTKGVGVYLGQAVANLIVDGARVSGVRLANGKVLPTDLVLLSVGVRPNIQLARDAGLEIGAMGGILVNEHLQTSDPDILAAGDAVEVVHAVTGKPALVPLAGPANKHGRLAGEFAATGTSAPAPRVAGTAIVKVFDLTVAVTGLSRRAAERSGIDADHVIVRRGHHVGYYPGAEPMTIKLIYEPGTRRVLGAQMVGGAGVDRRIDVVATTIHFGGTVDDLAALDLAYAPQYGAAKDPIHIAAFVAGNQDRGLVRHIDPDAVRASNGNGYLWIDVRTPAEHAAGTIPGAVLAEVDELRSRLNELTPSRPIAVFCEVGQRGYYAARILKGLGRSDVVNLAGGYAHYLTQQDGASAG
ncbi:MAG: FAD-dependent oxidoreductase [Phycisphaerae bacterium]|nr:FAD-dependent oxidoreductase [Phycisphaerae bacterium]